MPDAGLAELEALIDEPQLPERRDRMSALVAESLVVRPEVARAMANGMGDREICEFLGISRSQLRRYMDRSDFKILMEIECRRIMRHLSRRDLKSEKYLQLATSLGVLLDKMRVLNHEPEGFSRENVTTIIESLTIGIFGRGGGGDRPALDGHCPGDGQPEIQIVPERSDPDATGTIEPSSLLTGLERQCEVDRGIRQVCDDEG
jgi:hypothetical protein